MKDNQRANETSATDTTSTNQSRKETRKIRAMRSGIARRADQADLNWALAPASLLRIGFAVIWAVDAYFKWQPGFASMFVNYFQMAAQGQPHWLQPWFAFWLAVVTPNATFFLWATRITETLLAAGLLLGLARPWLYMLGAGYSLMIWSTAEGFGGPYGEGSTDVGAAVIYVFVFVGLLILYRIQGETPFTLDGYLKRHFPDWPRMVEWVPPLSRHRQPRLAEQVVSDRGRGSSFTHLDQLKQERGKSDDSSAGG